MSTTTNQGVPGIPLNALDAIQDENARLVLRAIVDGWHVRNGSSGKGDNAFVTRGEVGNLTSQAAGQAMQNFGGMSLKPGEINRVIDDLHRQVFESQLFHDLEQRINGIDLSVVAEQQARIAAIQQVASDLAAEAATRLGFDNTQGSAINSLQSVTNSQATQISGLTTRIGAAESTIVSLQSTTATQATSLSSLTTRVGSAESNITSLQTTTSNQAQSLSSLTTRVGSAESSISTLNTTTANQANSLSALTVRVASTESGITSEQTARANADNAITSSMTTQFATVNNNISGIQTQQTTTANNVAALTTTVTTLQAQVGANSAAISAEATARANADGDLYAQWTLRVDVNGRVSGFGLASSATVSDFIVRADRFSIVSPTGNQSALIMTNNTIRVYDENGALRVKIGNLAA